MEAAIRWSPHSTPNKRRFLILNLVEKYLKFYEVESLDPNKPFEYKQISQHTKLPNVRAFDWSSTEEALVAVGLPSGEAALLRIDDSSNDILSFTIKHQRPCNAIALSTKGLLAAGLDKVRNDFCLNIWDVNHRLASWKRESKGWAAAKSQFEPIRKLATSESISSIKFFTDQPDTLVTGVKGQFVRIYDLRESPGNPSLQFATRCTHNLSIDAREENYFASASFSGESLVCVWDRRAGSRSSAANLSSANQRSGQEQSGAILEYNVAADNPHFTPQSSIWSVRFSRSQRGSLGVLTSDGQLKTYETAKEYVPPEQTRHGEHQQLWTKRIRTIQPTFIDGGRGPPESSRVLSFDFMTYGQSEDEHSILIYQGDGRLQTFRLNKPPPPIDINFVGDAIVGTTTQLCQWYSNSGANEERSTSQIFKAIRDKAEEGNAAKEEPSIPANGAIAQEVESVPSSRRKHEQLLSIGSPGGKSLHSELLTAETTLCRRAKEGYLYDCALNIKILSDDPWLQNLWEWVERAEKAAKQDGMVYGHLDLSLLGVHSIWTRDLGRHTKSRLRGDTNELPNLTEFKNAVSAINRRNKRPKYDGVDTSFPEQRQLCLAICGWAKPREELEIELRSIALDESKTKAAGWAMFNDMPRQATQLVMRGDENEKLVAMALAGFYKQVGISKSADDVAWMDLCEEIRVSAKDPWSRAILALVTTEDWHAVLAETSLPLRDRIGVALRYLNDKELTSFLNKATKECVEYGDIEGICLTGITNKAMELFENYIMRTNDLSTAVLVMSIGCPVYVKDIRFWKWKRLYQTILNAARLHIHRCNFEMQHIQKGLTWDGRNLIQPPLRQISLRCNYCDRKISHDDDAETIVSESSDAPTTVGDSLAITTHVGNPLRGRGASQGVNCPRCNRHLPRCGVCDRWLGVPDPSRPPGSSSVDEDEMLARFMLFCNICDHAFHADHARTWFSAHKVCPISDCKCLCQAYEQIR
ncbi:MAG: hypothetical protein M1837_004092 [Sclerophora amabilis]|nr:MAG: hypothetical protein M1837_004092 [Sclerophora amabilis]